MKTISIIWLAVAACAGAPEIPAVRFANAPVASAVNDRRDVAKPPAKRLYLRELYFFDSGFYQPLTRPLELPTAHRARGVNAIDEVPDSTWFTNRIGARTLTPDEIRIGPATDDPELHKPWTVRSTKIGGTSLGYIIKDASGAKYMLKFEGKDDPPELETGTDVTVNRLLWACGYNVAEDFVVFLRPEDLILARDAAVKDADGEDIRKLERPELERGLDSVRHESDGRIRAMASRWIDGTTLGGHPGKGVRSDDPNDTIPHELRRDLRGQASIYAWLDALDVTEGQFVDAWVTDPADPKRHYLKHYAIDFGKSLGVMGADDHDWWHGSGYLIDFVQILRAIVTVGLEARPWQDRNAPKIRGVAALFEASRFDPGQWHTDLAGYIPFLTADRIDKFWGAKIVARFTRDQIHAAVEAGRFTDPRAVDYITETLVARQRTTEAYWFARVNPIDHVAATATPNGVQLCFDDLSIVYGLAPASTTRYALTGFDSRARPLGSAVVVSAAHNGQTCASIGLASGADGYTMVRIATTRPDGSGATIVHVARDPSSGIPRVIGLWRP